jgi:tRNA G18 (ribose-2'-O)-methylase SpoU
MPPPLIDIESPDDPRIAVYRSVRERDLVGREGRFIAEGEVVLRALSTSPNCVTESVLIDPKRADKLAPILRELGPQIPIYAAAQAVLDAIAGFHLHRGILAVGRRRADHSGAALLATAPPDALVLALFGIANHDNMGGLFRNAAAFGVHAVLLDPGCCDPLYRKAIRVSVGAALRVSFARCDDPFKLLQQHAFRSLALSPSGAATLSGIRGGGRVAVLLGAEGPGLPSDILAACESVSIPMAAGFDSLNVATAAGIVLHHLRASGEGA